MNTVDNAYGSISVGQFFDHDGRRKRVHAGAAVLLGNADALIPHFAELLDDLAGELALDVALHGARRDNGTGEVANAVAQHKMVFVQLVPECDDVFHGRGVFFHHVAAFRVICSFPVIAVEPPFDAAWLFGSSNTSV